MANCCVGRIVVKNKILGTWINASFDQEVLPFFGAY